MSINLCRSGTSTSVGEPGTTINVGRHDTHGTLGIPGTGIRCSEQLSDPNEPGGAPKGMGFGVLLVAVVLSLVAMVVYAAFRN